MFVETGGSARYFGLSGECEDEVARRVSTGYVFRGDRITWKASLNQTLLPDGFQRANVANQISAAGFSAVNVNITRDWGTLMIQVDATPNGDMNKIDDACSIFYSITRSFFNAVTSRSCTFIARANPCGTSQGPGLPPGLPPGQPNPSPGGTGGAGGGTGGGAGGSAWDSISTFFTGSTVGAVGGALLALYILTRR